MTIEVICSVLAAVVPTPIRCFGALLNLAHIAACEAEAIAYRAAPPTVRIANGQSIFVEMLVL